MQEQQELLVRLSARKKGHCAKGKARVLILEPLRAALVVEIADLKARVQSGCDVAKGGASRKSKKKR